MKTNRFPFGWTTYRVLLISLFIIFLTVRSESLISLVSAEELTDTISYKLALIHTKDLNPQKVFLGESITPSRSVLSEFQWIMQTLKGRCLNSEGAIATILLQSWKFVKEKGGDIRLLELAHQLTIYSKDTRIFGTNKVDFRMVANYWIIQNILKPSL